MRDECGAGGERVWEHTGALWVRLCSYGGAETHGDVNHSRGMRFSFNIFMPVIFPV